MKTSLGFSVSSSLSSQIASALLFGALLAGCSSNQAEPTEPVSDNPGDALPPEETPSADTTPAPSSGKVAACTFGQDQTCNAEPSVSSLMGHCEETGKCTCREGVELDPISQRCGAKPQ